MGFNPTFYAGRPKLSQVTIDSDLNMGGRDISGVDALQADTIGADLIRAGRVDSPYMPQTWPTETLSWGDIAAGNPVDCGSIKFETSETTHTLFTHSGSGRRYTVNFTVSPFTGLTAGATIKVAGVTMVTLPYVAKEKSYTSPSFPVDDGETVTITGQQATLSIVQYINTGIACGAKTFNLSGKWLALGLDMKGLAATVKIQGVEMPYSDYAKYFPIAPSELKISGNWSISQIRPDVEVYL